MSLHKVAGRWFHDAVVWVRAELHAAEVAAMDQQFLATTKGDHYLSMRDSVDGSLWR